MDFPLLALTSQFQSLGPWEECWGGGGGPPALLGTLKASSAQDEDSLSIGLGQASIYDTHPYEPVTVT